MANKDNKPAPKPTPAQQLAREIKKVGGATRFTEQTTAILRGRKK